MGPWRRDLVIEMSYFVMPLLIRSVARNYQLGGSFIKNCVVFSLK